MLIEKLENLFKKIAKGYLEKYYSKIKYQIKIFAPADLSLGDFSTNILFLFAKETKKSINEIFAEIKSKIEKSPYIDKLELVNGYLNIFINKKLLFENFKTILLKNFKFLENNLGRKQKLIIEYVSANPTGPLHLGNTRGAIIGDILAKLLKLSNFKVTKEYYVNDRGNQIEILVDSILYELGQKEYNENFYKGDYIKEVAGVVKNNLKTFDREKIKKIAIRYILDKFIKKPLKNLGTQFDNFYFETDLYKKGLDKKILKILENKKLIEHREGATWLLLTKLGEIKDEVLIKKDGEPTYFFSDILYNYEKFFIRKYKYSIILVSSDHHDHARRLLKTFTEIFHIKENNFKILIYQMVHIIKGEELLKMSKRKGIYITLDELIDLLGVNPIRFYFAKYSLENTVELDLDLALKETEDNPIWYVLYTYARFNNILKKAQERKLKIPNKKIIKNNLTKAFKYASEKESYIKILRKIQQLQSVCYEATKNVRTNLLTQYLIELCKELNSFYEKEKILEGDYQEIKLKLIFVIYIIKALNLIFHLLSLKPVKELYYVERKNTN